MLPVWIQKRQTFLKVTCQQSSHDAPCSLSAFCIARKYLRSKDINASTIIHLAIVSYSVRTSLNALTTYKYVSFATTFWAITVDNPADQFIDMTQVTPTLVNPLATPRMRNVKPLIAETLTNKVGVVVEFERIGDSAIIDLSPFPDTTGPN